MTENIETGQNNTEQLITGKIRPVANGWRTGTFRPRLWTWSWFLWTAFFMLPLWSGWILKLVFDRLETNESVNELLLAIGVTEVVRWIIFGAAVYFVVRWWVAALSMMRTNMLFAQTVSGGPKAGKLPGSPAESITRFNDDTRDTVLWTDSWLDGAGNLLYGIGAIAIMSTINRGAALVVILPLIVVTIIARKLTPRLYAARSADRKAGSQVSSFLGEVFSGQLAFRLAGREEAAVKRLEQYTSVRHKTAVRDTVLQQAIEGIASSTGDITIGLTLLVLVPSVRSGEFSVGDLALFVAYAVPLGELPRYVARLITSREQAIVSYGRLGQLVAPDRPDDLLEHNEVTIEPNDTMRRRDPDPDRVPLAHLSVRGLTARHTDSTGLEAGGVSDINLDVPAGSFTVITGGVGAGKTTLLRAIVGLIPISEGSVTWNDEPIDDLAAWFVPPNCAHLPQVPRLFSESLADNVLLGRDDHNLASVLDLTSLSYDLGSMPDDIDTMVGARGLRLSGGQAQRVATARSLLTKPELLIVDDLSSALDVATERELWLQLRKTTSITIIAVSHRRLAIDQADQVITLEAGRIVH